MARRAPPPATWLAPRSRILLTVLLAMLGLGGCVQVEDTLTIRTDGSGTISLVVIPSQKPDSLRARQFLYPPVQPDTAFHLLPAHRFQTKVEAIPGKDYGLRVTAAFPDLASLLASPYAGIHLLTVRGRGADARLEGSAGMTCAAAFSAEVQKDPPESKVDLKRQALQSLFWRFRLIGPGESAETVFDRARNDDDADMLVAIRKRIAVGIPGLAALKDAQTWLADLRFDRVEERQDPVPVADLAQVRQLARLQLSRLERRIDLNRDGGRSGELRFRAVIALPAGWTANVRPEYFNWGGSMRPEPAEILFTPSGENPLRGTRRQEMLELDETMPGEDWGDGQWRFRVDATFKVGKEPVPAIPLQGKLRVVTTIRAADIRAVLKMPEVLTNMPRTLSEGSWSSEDWIDVACPALASSGRQIRVQRDRHTGMVIVRAIAIDAGSMVEELQAYDTRGRALLQVRVDDHTWMVVEPPQFPLSLAVRMRLSSAPAVDLALEAPVPASDTSEASP